MCHQAREVAHSGHTSCLHSPPRAPTRRRILPSHRGGRPESRAIDYARLTSRSVEGRSTVRIRAVIGSRIPRYAAVLGQNRPEILARVPIPAHSGVARDLVAQPQDTPVAMVRDRQQSMRSYRAMARRNSGRRRGPRRGCPTGFRRRSSSRCPSIRTGARDTRAAPFACVLSTASPSCCGWRWRSQGKIGAVFLASARRA